MKVSVQVGPLRALSELPKLQGLRSQTGPGSVLARLVTDPGSRDAKDLLGWARRNRFRSNVALALQPAQGPGWALAWCSLHGGPLRRRHRYLVAYLALGVFVDGADVHVAAHGAREDGTVAVVGLWDARVTTDGLVARSWSEAGSRRLARHYGIDFPVQAVRQTVARARRTDPARPSRPMPHRPVQPDLAAAC